MLSVLLSVILFSGQENIKAKVTLKAEEPTLQQADPTEYEQKLIEACNAERTKRGLVALKPEPRLLALSRRWCVHMLSRGMYHSNYGVAENIASGQQNIPQVMNSWMNSSGHRANMLNPRHRYIGCTGYRKNGRIMWVQMFR